jgi:hypothetical protein
MTMAGSSAAYCLRGLSRSRNSPERVEGKQIGDPGYTIDDLALKPEDYRRLGIDTPVQRSRKARWNDPEIIARLNTPRKSNVIEFRKRAPSSIS